MAVIKCKMCGGDMEIAADKTFGTCEYCGSTMTLPKVDDDQRAAMFNRGNHFRRVGEFDKALAVYERIVAEDDTDAEAHWCCALCRFGIEYVEDPNTYEYLPTCHRASFDSFLEDVDYLAAVEHSAGITRRQYQKDAAKIADVQRGILATSQNEEPFDVFICYKETDENGQRTRDSLLAQDIYYQLTEAGRRVFFARITLEDKVGSQYEPYIFAALNSAKVMVAVGTKPEHFSAVWVKNEWSRFLAMMRKDRSKLLLPCYRDMDPYDLPEQLSVLQSYDMSKIGFIQDLIRGINKVLDADKKPESVKETVIVQQAAPTSNSNTSALLKRGQMALEDREWDRAYEFFEEVLNQDAECAEAYLGELLAQKKVSNLNGYFAMLQNQYSSVSPVRLTACEEDARHIENMASECYVPGYLDKQTVRNLYGFNRDYSSGLSDRKEQKTKQLAELSSEKLLNRTRQYAQGALKQNIENGLKDLEAALDQRIAKAQTEDEASIARVKAAYQAHLDDADKKAKGLRTNAENTREKYYQSCVTDFRAAASIPAFEGVSEKLLKINGYKDTAELLKKCQEEIERRKEAARLEAERQAEQDRQEAARKAEAERIAAEKSAKTQRKVIAIVSAITVIFIVVMASLNLVIIPGKYYNEATELRDTNPLAAAILYSKAGNYQDARAQTKQLWDEYAVRDSISAGTMHSLGLKSNGTVVAVGQNGSDQCKVSDWSGIVAVSEGNHHSVGLKSDGTVIAVGCNPYYNYGQDKVSDWTDIVAVSAGGIHTVGLKSNGTVVAVGNNKYGQCNVSDWTDIVAVSASAHTVGLKSDGTVIAVGYNEDGECNVSDWTDIVAVSSGMNHTVGLKANGTVVAVGKNEYGQCDVFDWNDIVEISSGGYYTVGLKSDGTVIAVGHNSNGQCAVNSWEDIVAISAGGTHTVGLKSDGTVVATGGNEYGKCDVSDWKNIKVPEEAAQRVKEASASVIQKRMQAKYDEARAMMSENPQAAAIAFGKLGDYQDAAAISRQLWDQYAQRDTITRGNYHTVGLKNDGTVVAVGNNEYGQCNVSDWTKIVAISARNRYTTGLKEDGTVVAVGDNKNGQCDASDWNGIVAISAGDDWLVGLKSDGTVVAVGSNKYGQCDVSDWTDVVSVKTMGSRTFGLRTDGTILSTGDFNDSVNVWKDITAMSAHVFHTVGLKSDGTVVAAGEKKYGACNVSDWTDIVAVSVNRENTMGLKSDGTVVSAGSTKIDSAKWKNIVSISSGALHTVGLKTDGMVVAAGWNDDGQCNVSGWRNIAAISAGYTDTIGIRADGTVIAVGSNKYGQYDVSGWKDIRLPNK